MRRSARASSPAFPTKLEDAALITVDQLAQMHTGKPWLLIYDNADGPALLRKFTPADNAHVLITTRRTDWHGETDDELAVDVFDRDTAIAYLLKQARNGDADAAGRLADALHCLPLALSHARAYCWARNWSFDRYIARLPELIDEAPKDAPYPASVFATFSLAIENAAKECAEAETLMALLAFFAPDKIPLWLIPEDVLSEKQRDEALAALTSVSLAAYDSLPDGAPAVSVHRLVQEVMRGRLRNSGRFEDTAALAIKLLYDAYDFYSGTVATMHRRAAWLPHALAAMDHAPREGDKARQTVWVCNFIGDFRVSRGELDPAHTAYDQGLRIAERLAKSDPGNAGWQRDLSVSYNKVGDVLVDQGRPARGAESLSRQPRHLAAWHTLWTLIQIGDFRVSRGELSPARTAYTRVLSPSPSASPRPIPAMRDGSAISRSPMRRWAMCSWPRATCPRR